MPDSPPSKALDNKPDDTAVLEGPASSLPAVSDPNSDLTTDFTSEGTGPSASTSKSKLLASSSSRAVQESSIGGYRLDKLLGEGGMGRVFRATDSQGRAVAIKLLSARWSGSSDALERFKKEGYIASQINHPNCVFVHRVDEDRGTPFIAMELMTGQTLKDLVTERGPIPFKEAAGLILQCIDGLIEAHHRGMIHRDIKPANCYLDEHGNVKVGDFGLARSLVDDSELTRTGAFLGTPLFASPEQLLGEPLDERSDIYSLSATLYYLLAGKAPFESPNAAQVIAKIASFDPPSFSQSGVEVPPTVEAIVMRGLARDKNKRFGSLLQLRAALLPIVTSEDDIARLPRRTLAGFIDLSVLAAMGALVTMTSFALRAAYPAFFDFVTPLTMACGKLLALVLYFGLTEGLLGSSLGKRLIRLRVVETGTGGRVKLRYTLGRAIVFAVTIYGLWLIGLVCLDDTFWLQGVLSAASLPLGCLVMLVSWKLSHQKQLFHEWLTRTYTKAIIPIRSGDHARMQLPGWSVPAIPLSTPRSIGRFTVTSQLKTIDGSQWYVARDDGVDREVWIHVTPFGAPGLTEERKKCTRRLRMRLIESGSVQSGNSILQTWDAYLAPEGAPVVQFIAHNSVLTWPLTRQLFYQLLDDYHNADGGRLRDEDWNSQQIWLDSAGRATFCEPKLESEIASRAPGMAQVLRDIAWAALPVCHPLRRKQVDLVTQHLPQLSRPAEANVSDLPTFRSLKLLERIVKGQVTPEQLRTELQQVDQSSDQVTATARLAHAITLAIVTMPFIAIGYMACVAHSIIVTNQVIKESRGLVTLAELLETAEQNPRLLDDIHPPQREVLTKPETIAAVREASIYVHHQAQLAYSHLNAFERAVLSQTKQADPKSIEAPPVPYKITPPAAKENPQLSTETVTQETVNLPIAGSPSITYQASDNSDMTSEQLVEQYYPVALRWQSKKFHKEGMAFFVNMILWPAGILWIWTIVFAGGLVQVFTGVTAVRRDGCRASRARLAWRSLLLLAPLVLIALASGFVGAGGPAWLGVAELLKNLYVTLPLIYIVCAFVWPQIGPHDRLSYTAVVPR